MHQDRTVDRRPGRLPFVLSLWMSLLTAIVCAVVPTGLPLTRSTGSAFDPSTTIVALRSRPPAPVKATVQRSGEGDAAIGDGPAAIMLPAAPAFVHPTLLRFAADRILPVFSFVPRAIPIALHARPPPAA